MGRGIYNEYLNCDSYHALFPLELTESNFHRSVLDWPKLRVNYANHEVSPIQQDPLHLKKALPQSLPSFRWDGWGGWGGWGRWGGTCTTLSCSLKAKYFPDELSSYISLRRRSSCSSLEQGSSPLSSWLANKPLSHSKEGKKLID